MTPATRKALLWGSLVALGLYLWGRLEPRGDDRELQQQFERSLGMARTFHVKLAQQAATSSHLDSALATERARRLRTLRNADSLRGVGDSLSRALEGAGSDSLPIALGLIEALRGEGASLRFAVASLQVEADSVLADRDRWRQVATESGVVIDSLRQTMVALRDASRCRVLFVACPSRATVGLVGVVAGVVGTVLLVR